MDKDKEILFSEEFQKKFAEMFENYMESEIRDSFKHLKYLSPEAREELDKAIKAKYGKESPDK